MMFMNYARHSLHKYAYRCTGRAAAQTESNKSHDLSSTGDRTLPIHGKFSPRYERPPRLIYADGQGVADFEPLQTEQPVGSSSLLRCSRKWVISRERIARGQLLRRNFRGVARESVSEEAPVPDEAAHSSDRKTHREVRRTRGQLRQSQKRGLTPSRQTVDRN